jgi:hypothetical protein
MKDLSTKEKVRSTAVLVAEQNRKVLVRAIKQGVLLALVLGFLVIVL